MCSITFTYVKFTITVGPVTTGITLIAGGLSLGFFVYIFSLSSLHGIFMLRFVLFVAFFV